MAKRAARCERRSTRSNPARASAWNAQHHQCFGDRFYLAAFASAAQVSHMGQQLQGHQGVAGDGLGQQVRIDRVFGFAHFIQGHRRAGQYGQVLQIEQRGPAGHVAWRAFCEGRGGGLHAVWRGLDRAAAFASSSTYRPAGRHT